MRTRGYALLVVVGMLAALGVTGVIAMGRVTEAVHEGRALDERVQLLWLARSALAHGAPANVEGISVSVSTVGGVKTATAKKGTMVATVNARGEERFQF